MTTATMTPASRQDRAAEVTVVSPSRDGSSSRVASNRILALDFTKGALVLIMVLYHWLNYFVSPYGEFYRYLRFLTPSFIFITGFLVSHVYLSGSRRADRGTAQRMAVRGLKILAIFVVLNVARSFVERHSADLLSAASSMDRLVAIFVTGTTDAVGNAKPTAFNILVPIGYLLILSAALSVLARRLPHTFQIAGVCGLAAIYALGAAGLASGHLEYVTVGLLGVTLGFVPVASIAAMVRSFAAVAAVYVVYLSVITVWGLSFPLQIVGVFVNLLVIFALGARPGWWMSTYSHILLLGQYSLFGYIAQIAVLQALQRVLSKLPLHGALLPLSFVLACALTVVVVEALDLARRRLPPINVVYKAVFA